MYTRNRAPELHCVAPSERDLSPHLFFWLGYFMHLSGKYVAKFNDAMSILLRDMCVELSLSRPILIHTHSCIRLHELRHQLSPFRVTTECPYTNLILDIFAIHLNTLRQRSIWGISHSEIDYKCLVFQYNQKGAPERRWAILAFS